MPDVGDSAPQLQPAETPFESRERKKLRLDAMTLAIGIDNRVRARGVQVDGFAPPPSVDPRTVPTQPVNQARPASPRRFQLSAQTSSSGPRGFNGALAKPSWQEQRAFSSAFGTRTGCECPPAAHGRTGPLTERWRWTTELAPGC